MQAEKTTEEARIMYSSKAIREALREGAAQGVRLFPEIRDASWRAGVARHPCASRLAAEALRLAEHAAAALPAPVTFDLFMSYARDGSRDRYDLLLTRRLRDLAALTMAAMLEGPARWIGAIEERLWDIANLYVWELNAVLSLDVEKRTPGRPNPRQTIGLLTAETAFQVAETLDLLGEALDPFLAYRLRCELAERVFEPYRDYAYWWQSSSTNWQAVCSASIGCAALYCIKDDAELAIVLGKVLQGLQSYLEGFDGDGVTAEGLEYWAYGFSSYVLFAELLHERTAGRLRLLEEPERVGKIAGFPRAITLSGGCVVNFSDCDERGAVPRYLASRLGRRLGIAPGSWNLPVVEAKPEAGAEEGEAANAGAGEERRIDAGQDTDGDPNASNRWPYWSRSLTWLPDAEEETERSPAAGMVFFSDAQWLVDKRWTGAGQLVAFAAKGGHNDEPHNHNDLGHFILHVAGRNVMPDLGAPAYTRDTFTDRRYDHLANSSRGHAVPIVDGHMQKPGREMRAETSACRDDGERTVFGLRLEHAYGLPGLLGLSREWEWHYAEWTLRMKDGFSFSTASHDVVETLLFREEPRVARPGMLEVDAGACKLEVAYPAAADVRTVRETYATRKGEEASVYVVSLGIPCPGRNAEVDIAIRIRLP